MTNQTILHVEDDPNDVFFLDHAFKRAEITAPLQVVNDGQDAIDYLSASGIFSDRTRFPMPCLVILDLKMPRKDGLQVLQWLRQESNCVWLPVIVLSSSSLASDVDRAYRLGANSFVVKPADINRRIEFAKYIKGYWLEFHEPPPICTI
jgi:CheY-like chemotaxis protein